LTGLRGSRFGVPGHERRKPGRSLPSPSRGLFGKKKRKSTKKKRRTSAKRRTKAKAKRRSTRRKGTSAYKGKRKVSRVGAKRRKKSKKLSTRPKMLYGLRGSAAKTAAMSLVGQAAKDAQSRDHMPVLGAYKHIFATKEGWASMTGAVAGYQLTNITAAALYKLGAALFNKEGAAPVVTPGGFGINILADFLTAGLLWEAGQQFGAENFGTFAAVVAATRSMNAYASQYLTAPLMGQIGLNQTASVSKPFAFGAWHEYGYEGGGVGLYRESDSAPLGLYREAEDAPLGVVRVPDGAMLGLGQDTGAMFEQGNDDGTLFG
jgi:hypothetical protein